MQYVVYALNFWKNHKHHHGDGKVCFCERRWKQHVVDWNGLYTPWNMNIQLKWCCMVRVSTNVHWKKWVEDQLLRKSIKVANDKNNSCFSSFIPSFLSCETDEEWWFAKENNKFNFQHHNFQKLICSYLLCFFSCLTAAFKMRLFCWKSQKCQD